MTRAWRLTTRAREDTALSGEGARRFGGRWNPPGVAAVYAAATISLAALEYLAGADVDLAPPDLVVIPVEWGADVPLTVFDAGHLPRGWRAFPHPTATRDLGGEWLRGQVAPVLSVPSAIVPEERIFVLNPSHPLFDGLVVGPSRPFTYDPRLW